MKSAGNARAYKRRTIKAVLDGSDAPAATIAQQLGSQDISDHLIALAQRPLSSSRLFNEALGSPDALDESDLGVWDSRPPYRTLPAHLENDAECRFTERLVQVMHGRRFRKLRTDGEDRARRAGAAGVEDMVRELEERVAELLAVCCEDPPEAIASEWLPGSSRDLCMASHHHEWSARTLYCLHSDLRILRERGAVDYRTMYHRNELAWQVIQVE